MQGPLSSIFLRLFLLFGFLDKQSLSVDIFLTVVTGQQTAKQDFSASKEWERRTLQSNYRQELTYEHGNSNCHHRAHLKIVTLCCSHLTGFFFFFLFYAFLFQGNSGTSSMVWIFFHWLFVIKGTGQICQYTAHLCFRFVCMQPLPCKLFRSSATSRWTVTIKNCKKTNCTYPTSCNIKTAWWYTFKDHHLSR